jgi:hypothetical protein
MSDDPREGRSNRALANSAICDLLAIEQRLIAAGEIDISKGRYRRSDDLAKLIESLLRFADKFPQNLQTEERNAS